MRWYSGCIFFILLYLVISILSIPSLQQYVVTHRDNILWTSNAKVFSQANNGDIILWSSNRKIIQYASDGPFTHVNMIFRDYEGDEKGNQCLYCWEVDVGQGHPYVIRLKDKMKNYKGVSIMGWKPLVKGTRPTSPQLLKIASSYLDYTTNRITLIRWLISRVLAATPCKGGKVQNLLKSKIFKQVFCSELIAETLQQVEILDLDLPASQYMPCDWLYNNLSLKSQNKYGPTYFFRSKKF